MFSLGACFGGRSPIVKPQRYFDSLLDNLVIYKNHNGRPHDNDIRLYPVDNVDVHKVWEVFRQQFIDECFNKGSRVKWTAVPYLNVADSPCEPGSVIMVKNRKFKEKLTNKPNVAFFAGSNMDYIYTTDIEESSTPPIQVKTSATKLQRNYFRVYQSKHSEKAAMISLVMEDRRDMLSPGDFEKVRMDIDIFEDTGIKNKYCYIVTNVLTARSLKLEMTEDGDIFYELEFKAAVPICFQATKVRVIFDTKGMLEKIKPVKNVLNLTFRRKRVVDPLLNAFMPNQNRLNNFGGDCPPVIPIILPLPIQSFRPKILPRQDRPKNDVIWYFTKEAELRSIQYNFYQDPRLNRLYGAGSVTDEDTDDETDDDISEGDDSDSNGVGHPYSFYPPPEIRPIDFQD